MEDFALAEDRETFLAQLIPSSEDYYYYHALHWQHTGQWDRIEKLMPRWQSAFGRTPRHREIRLRQALLQFKTDPKSAYRMLEMEAPTNTRHQREADLQKTSYPNRLDPALISQKTLMKEARAYSSNLSGFSDAALDWLIDEKLSVDERHLLLQRLTRPDYAQLPKLVYQDLKSEGKGSFGNLSIHNLMMLDQLDELQSMKKELAGETAFVYAKIRQLQPGPDVEWEDNDKEREIYLERLMDYVSSLSPAFNGLKIQVLYHILELGQRRGEYDTRRFSEYIQLPRQANYMDRDFLKLSRHRDHVVRFGDSFNGITLLAPVHDDEPLVRDYLENIFRESDDYSSFSNIIRDDYLKRVFATTKILSGKGDVQRWNKLLNNPSHYQTLKDRVDLEFARSNPKIFDVDTPVSLDVFVKNVKTLVVKVFEINTLNYYLSTGKEIDTTIDLDGMIAGEETTYTYDDAPIKRVRRTFTFESLNKPGVFIIEMLGGGRSSRALIRKGSLHFIERLGSAGHVFSIFDQTQTVLKETSIWLGGREYKSDVDGEIAIPYSTSPKTQTILLRYGNMTSLGRFNHRSEQYDFSAGIYVDRESLIKGRNATVAIRPFLSLNNIPIRTSLLEDQTLAIESMDIDGIASTMEVHDFKLDDHRETVHEFKVPENLVRLSFTVKGRIESLSTHKKVDLSDRQAFALNGIDRTAQTFGLHLSKNADHGYVVSVLGKTGEPRVDTPINIRLHFNAFKNIKTVTLQTDSSGAVRLGELKGVSKIEVSCEAAQKRIWSLSQTFCRYPRFLNTHVGQPIQLPYTGMESQVRRSSFSLLASTIETFKKDYFNALSLKDGSLIIDALPAGDYDLLFKETGNRIVIRVSEGCAVADWLVSPHRMLKKSRQRRLYIQSAALKKGALSIQLAHTSSQTRIHIFGTRFVPDYDLFDPLSPVSNEPSESIRVDALHSQYVSGRDIGDEYRYILDRKYQRKFSGNMLSRPGLLLNPWAVRSTHTETAVAAAGAAYGGSPEHAKRMKQACAPAPKSIGEPDSAFNATLDFLKQPAVVLHNIEPDEAGFVSIPAEQFAHVCHVRVVATDSTTAVCREVLLPAVQTAPEDLRLKQMLDLKRHFSEKKQITVLAEGSAVKIDDITTAEIENYDTLTRVYHLFKTLTSNEALDEFSFLLSWPSMDETEKQKKYSEFACHELNLFLSRKDSDFFRTVIQPYLKNKKDKTFMDRYLLGDDLSGYRVPWQFQQLNVVEQLLMADRIGDESKMARYAKDLYEVLPIDVEGDNRLFKTAIRGSALDTGDTFGMQAAAEALPLLEMDDFSESCAPMPCSAPPPQRPMLSKRSRQASFDMKSTAMVEDEADWMGEKDDSAREEISQLYDTLDKTSEWAENNYYKIPFAQQGADLVSINAFWKDFAARDKTKPFLSKHIAQASENFTEMMCALAVLDLPFSAASPEIEFDGSKMTLNAVTPSILFHKEIKPAAPSDGQTAILVNQNYLRDDDRYRYDGNEQTEKYVTGEFLVQTVYVCKIVLTNPSIASLALDLLLQIPQGAVPVENGFYTKSRHLFIGAYETQTIEYKFYFPAAGTFHHFPVQVTRNETLIASAKMSHLNVVQALSTIDKTSWSYISQNGNEQAVLEYLETHNINRLDLSKIAWRMRDKKFYKSILQLLDTRYVFNRDLWGYSCYHKDEERLKEYLSFNDGFVQSCGLSLESPVLAIDPISRRFYEHLEYAPLVNARTYPLCGRHRILNDRFRSQYEKFMKLLCYRPALTDSDMLALVYYLLVQERIEDALKWFARIDPSKIETRIQYDYLAAYVSFFEENIDSAKTIARQYEDYPVVRWRNLFKNVLAQISEAEGQGGEIVDDTERSQRQDKQADRTPGFEFSIEDRRVRVQYQNLSVITVNYYCMDIELLFSRRPFVQQQTDKFSFISPNRSDRIALRIGEKQLSFDIPDEYRASNVVIEIVSEGIRKNIVCFANELNVQLISQYGQVKVTSKGENRPLSRTYIKVYARFENGEVQFYKDGYTDIRGRFDYTSLSTNALDNVERFALLILHADRGAVIRETDPPKR